MKHIRVDLTEPEGTRRATRAGRDCLMEGGVALLPAEGLYGLHAGAGAPAAVARVRALKQIARPRPFILLVHDIEAALVLIAEPRHQARGWMERCWPGAVTLVLPAAPSVDAALTHDGRVAVRCPGSALLRGICAALPGPVLSTSANRAGADPPRDIAAIEPALRAACDLVVDGGALSGEPSAVLRLEPGGGVRVLRPARGYPAGAVLDPQGRRRNVT